MAKPTQPSAVDPKSLEGKKAPAVTLDAVGPDGTTSKVKLSDFADKKNVVLYFYPKDDTPGCTTEACGFRDLSADFAKVDTVVLGVSCDGVESHAKFVGKYQLPFALLSDPDAAAATKYGVWKEKVRFGKKSLGIVRTTFVIDKAGRVAKVYKTVKPDVHNEQVIGYIRENLA
ncbi:MAG: putative peroxiredoxin bcp [Phycisphaerae bacterium]|nr:putative peroxiredoxin bcp [Phycisphaerae bacterium]